MRSLGGFACAELATGGVRCWGMRDNTMWPEATTGSCPAVEVTFALRRATLAGRPSSWTSSDLRDSGVREVVLAGVADAVAVAAGEDFACARTRRGDVWCWGDNDLGQLGDGREPLVTAPTLSLEALAPR